MKFPDKARNAFQNNMQTGGTVELPFPAPAFYVVNGNAQLAALNNFQFFGGWACNTDKLKFASDTWENARFPIPGLTEAETVLDNGNKLKVFASRSLLVAPIGMRQFSSLIDPVAQKPKRVAPFTPGGRPGVQVLCLLGFKNEETKTIEHWAPIMLTTKGYQVNNVQKAFTSWQKAIKPLLKKLSPEAPSGISSLFWMSIGTFGPERKQEIVGSGQQRKPITPVSAYIPDSLDETMLERLYVGDHVAEWMADLSEQAQEWLKVFENMPQPQKSHPATPAGEPEFDLDEPPPSDEYPF